MNKEKYLVFKYKYDVNKDEKERHNSLNKAIVIMGPLQVYKIIKKMYNSNQKDENIYSKLKEDKRWIKKNHSLISYKNESGSLDKKSKKKSRKKSKRKSRKSKKRVKSK
jgi:hypothetical protein